MDCIWASSAPPPADVLRNSRQYWAYCPSKAIKSALFSPNGKDSGGFTAPRWKRPSIPCAELLCGDESSVAQVTQKVAIRIPAQTTDIVLFCQIAGRLLRHCCPGSGVFHISISAIIAGSPRSILNIRHEMISPLDGLLRSEFSRVGISISPAQVHCEKVKIFQHRHNLLRDV